AMVRATKELLSGKQNPVEWFYNMARAATYKGIWDNPKMGYGLLQAFKGQKAVLNSHEIQSLKLMAEGGFIPEMSSQYRNKAIDNFRASLARGSATAAWHAPFAAIQLLSKPIFEIWIPSLKIASYLH